MSTAADYRAPRRTPEFSAEAIEALAARACSLQGLPEAQYRLLSPVERQHFERGVYNVLAALESLGWALRAPDEASRLWLPK